MIRKQIFAVIFIIITASGFCQTKKIAIGFWNIENLYDTINDPKTEDEEFTPTGKNKWTTARYKKKIENLSHVISLMGTDSVKSGLSIIGLCEIENRAVLNDLVNSEKLKKRNYKIVHFDGPDARGNDPALLYDPSGFKEKKAVTYPVTLPTDPSHKTRDQLVVSGDLKNEKYCFIVIHWPSRRNGEADSRPNRIAAAKVTRHIADSVLKNSPECKLVIMGDFNDDPTDESIKVHLRSAANAASIQDGELFDPMEKKYSSGEGTLAYKNKWNLFDQFLLSKSAVNPAKGEFHFSSANIFSPDFVKESEEAYKGQPLRTFAGSKYLGGYSDHFPVYLILSK